MHTFIQHADTNKTDFYQITNVEISEFKVNDTFYQREFDVPHLCLRPYDPIALPKLPDNFRTSITYSQLESKVSWSLTEYVDHQNNRARIDFYSRNTTQERYFDYNTVRIHFVSL
jgi:hypothetical protein